MIVLEVVVLGW